MLIYCDFMARQRCRETLGQVNQRAVIKSVSQTSSLVSRCNVSVIGLGLKSRTELVIHVIK